MVKTMNQLKSVSFFFYFCAKTFETFVNASVHIGTIYI